MQLKPITAILVLLLLVASLSISGCTSSPILPSPIIAGPTGPLKSTVVPTSHGDVIISYPSWVGPGDEHWSGGHTSNRVISWVFDGTIKNDGSAPITVLGKSEIRREDNKGSHWVSINYASDNTIADNTIGFDKKIEAGGTYLFGADGGVDGVKDPCIWCGGKITYLLYFLDIDGREYSARVVVPLHGPSETNIVTANVSRRMNLTKA
jgi:hypothetical protein